MFVLTVLIVKWNSLQYFPTLCCVQLHTAMESVCKITGTHLVKKHGSPVAIATTECNSNLEASVALHTLSTTDQATHKIHSDIEANEPHS